MRVVVSGASGFVGGYVCHALLQRGWAVRALVREERELVVPAPCEFARMPDLDGAVWTDALRGCDAVIHLAARVHRSGRREPDEGDRYRRENVDATLALARAAEDAGIGRMVFMSTIKVFGETSTPVGFKLGDPPMPQDPYSISKLEAERGLEQLAVNSALNVMVVRPPMVYGPGVKANFLRLLRCIDRGLPVPVNDAAVRSLVFAGNLADLCAHLLNVPIRGFATFLIADVTLSTRQLVGQLARSMGRPARSIVVPTALGSALSRLPVVGPPLRRLTSPLAVDASQSFRLARWRPVVSVDDALAATVAWYRQNSDR